MGSDDACQSRKHARLPRAVGHEADDGRRGDRSEEQWGIGMVHCEPAPWPEARVRRSVASMSADPLLKRTHTRSLQVRSTVRAAHARKHRLAAEPIDVADLDERLQKQVGGGWSLLRLALENELEKALPLRTRSLRNGRQQAQPEGVNDLHIAHLLRPWVLK